MLLVYGFVCKRVYHIALVVCIDTGCLRMLQLPLHTSISCGLMDVPAMHVPHVLYCYACVPTGTSLSVKFPGVLLEILEFGLTAVWVEC